MSHFHGSQGQCHGKGVVNSESDGVTAAPPSLSWHRGSSEEAREPICGTKPSLLPGDRELLCPVPRGTRLDAVPYIEAGQTRRGKRAFTLMGLYPYQAVGSCAAPKQVLVPPFVFAT